MKMIERINEARTGRGLPPLAWDARLAEAAMAHALDMSRHSGMVHIGSDGSDGGARIARVGYRAVQWREVVGWGFDGDPAQMMAWWLASPVHFDTLMATDVTEAGVSYVYAPGSAWGHYWVVDLAVPVVGQPTAPPVPDAPPVVYVPVVVGGPPVAPPTGAIDLLDYMRGDGRSYRVGNSRGSFEIFQTQIEGDRFYQVKAWDDLSVVNYEEFIVTGAHIGRDVDTSPGGGRFYRQFGAAWVHRHMHIGETFTQGKRIQFYRLESCVPVEQHSGDVIDRITLYARHERYTFPARDWPAVTLDDVIELRWLNGGESYWYARGFGLVGWARTHQDPHSPQWSAISEMRPDVGRLARLRIDCL